MQQLDMTDKQPRGNTFNEPNVLLLSDDDIENCGVLHRELSIVKKKPLFSEETNRTCSVAAFESLYCSLVTHMITNPVNRSHTQGALCEEIYFCNSIQAYCVFVYFLFLFFYSSLTFLVLSGLA